MTSCAAHSKDKVSCVGAVSLAIDYSEQSLATSQDSQHFKASAATQDIECPPWEENDNTGDCVCGSYLQDLVICKDHPYELQLYSCFCMTYSQKENQSLVGPCQYACRRSKTVYLAIPVNSTHQLNDFLCSPFKRQGQLCGSCEPGHRLQ